MVICTLAIIVITDLRGIITIPISLAALPAVPKPNGGGSAGVIMVVQ